MEPLTKQDEVWIIVIAILVLIGIAFLFSLIPYSPGDWSVPGFY